MHNKRRALLAAVLVAIPAPFVLGFLLQIFSPELFYFRTAGDAETVSSDVLTLLGSSAGYMGYLVSFILFAVVGFITALLASRGTSEASAPASAKRRAVARGADNEEGEVKWFNVKKGFGFITRDSGDDIFVHFRAIEGEGRRILRQGQRVTYIVVQSEKGLQADRVEVLDED